MSHPAKYNQLVQLKDGTPARLRPIRPEDDTLLAQMFQHLSKASLYYRFFGYIPEFSNEFLARYTQIDEQREVAIVAEIDDEDTPQLIGVVRIIADVEQPDRAEYAILIADPWQRLGLGYLLTDFILHIAQDRGIGTVYASVLATNKGMLHLFEKMGFTIRREGFDVFYAERDLLQ